MTTAWQPANLGLRNLTALWRLGARAVLIGAFLVAGGALSLQLSGLDPHAPVGGDTASLRSQIAIGLAFVILFLFGLRDWRRIGSLLRANVILLAVPALAILSVFWAPEPVVALRRALAFTATILSGFAIVAYLPGYSSLRFAAQAAAAGIVLSLVYMVVCPGYGVHQITDGVQSVHAGDWRGLFVHRTVLGHLAAFCLAAGTYAGPSPFRYPWIRAIVLASAMACLYAAHSGGGWASAAILMATPWILKGVRRLISKGRLVGIGAGVCALILILLLAPWFTTLTLSLLGKDPTLTGRTALWRLMLRAVAERPVFGYGYSTGFRDVVAKMVEAHSRFGYVPNAQNGYLDVVLNLGLVGLVATLAVMGLALWRAILLAGADDGLALLPLLAVAFMAALNLVEATLISANDIFVLLYTVTIIAAGDSLKRSSAPVCDPPPRLSR